MTKKEVVEWLESLKKEIGRVENRTLWHYAEAIDITIEALKFGVVRCEDCKHWIEVANACTKNSLSTYSWEYCSDGERSEP